MNTPAPPYIVVSEAQWVEIAEALATGADHPLAIEGLPVVVKPTMLARVSVERTRSDGTTVRPGEVGYEWASQHADTAS